MIWFKRGDTLEIKDVVLAEPETLEHIALDDIDIRCQARTPSGELAIDFTVVKHTHSYDLLAGDTSDCPLGELIADVEYHQGGQVFSTVDFWLYCREDRTYD